MRLVRLIIHLEEQKVVGRLGRDFFALLQPSQIMFQHITTLCACHRRLPSIGDTKQAMGKGKSGQVETRLTRPVAMALCHNTLVTECCNWKVYKKVLGYLQILRWHYKYDDTYYRNTDFRPIIYFEIRSMLFILITKKFN